MVSNIVGVLIQLFINRRTAELTAVGAVPLAATPGSKGAARATDKASNQKTTKSKGKRGQERRGGAEAEGF